MPAGIGSDVPEPNESGRGRHPTIYDVARHAGVAASTVSRAFSRPGRVNAVTAERVRKVAAELGYRTNPLARALPTGRSRMVALIVADITNPFNFGIIRGAEQSATAAGYTMILMDSQESQRMERNLLDQLLPTIEGVVLASPRMSDAAIRLIAEQAPTVVLNRAVPGVCSVVTDIRGGMRRAVEHLAELGHRHVIYVSGPESSWTDGMRWRALLEAGQDRGLKVRRLGPFSPVVASGTQVADALSHENAGAVVAYNDLLAIGLLMELRERGLRLPKRLSVVGFDDIFGADLITPGLTTVRAPLLQLGQSAVEHLLSLVTVPPRRIGLPVTIPTELVVRASTAPPWRGRSRGRAGHDR